MSTPPPPDPVRLARDRLRAVHERQHAALAAFVTAATKLQRQRATITELETAFQQALGALVECSDTQTAAHLADVTIATARDAASAYRTRHPNPLADNTANSAPAER